MTRTEQVMALLAEGLSTAEVARKMGITRASVYSHKSNARVQAGRRSLLLDQLELRQAVRDAYDSGATAKEIAERFGLTIPGVRNRIFNYRMATGAPVRDLNDSEETPLEARRRVARELADGKRCRRCYSPLGSSLCTAERCELNANPPLRRFDMGVSP